VAVKLTRKTLPAGTSAAEFKYTGRPANDQGDFGSDVGIADMACVNQFGEANNSKYYHAGVVKSSSGKWFVYLEWGRITGAGNSWNGGFGGGDYQFVECSDEADARSFFASQCADKNTKRLTRTVVAGKDLWCAKADKDGYLVQRLATRTRGLPDAYTIKDATGVAKAATPVVAVTSAGVASPPPKPVVAAQPQVVALAQALVGGTKDYSRAASAATGIVPTKAAIDEVRNDCIPAALSLLATIGPDTDKQLGHSGLRDLSKYVATVVPRPIPRGGDPLSILLTSSTIQAVQLDLDAFESALGTEDFSAKTGGPTGGYDPNAALNADLRWVDPTSDEGKWLLATFLGMTNNRHGYLGGTAKIVNAFAVNRPDRDLAFQRSVQTVASRRAGRFGLRANLQPRNRIDVESHLSDDYTKANVVIGQHGTRSVNVAPILQSHYRLPKSLKGVPIAGANFGHGTYFATDYKKSIGYTSHSGSVWSSGGGGIASRGAFMFLNDFIMGDAYRAPSTGSWTTPPDGKDSVFGVGGDRGHALQNDEHVIFDPTYARIRYVIEFRM
jgi:hypothetical protein